MHHIETHKHRLAKDLLASWFSDYTVTIEQPFYIDGYIAFIPDVTVLEEKRVLAVYEVVHKHGLTGKKLGVIQSWCYRNYDIDVFEISADYILEQVDKPLIIGYEVHGIDKFTTPIYLNNESDN